MQLVLVSSSITETQYSTIRLKGEFYPARFQRNQSMIHEDPRQKPGERVQQNKAGQEAELGKSARVEGIKN